MKSKVELATDHLNVMTAIRPAPKPVREKKGRREKYVSPRKRLEIELEKAMRELCWWRDGGECVLRDIDGRRCAGSIQWGHFVPRKQSAYLKFAIGNTFCQCAGHNFRHWHGDHIFGLWYDTQFGIAAHKAMLDVAGKGEPSMDELEDWLARVRYLLDDRPALYTFPILVELGYYGDFMKGK
jgi:hypothetical protein